MMRGTVCLYHPLENECSNIKQISARPITNFSLTPAWMVQELVKRAVPEFPTDLCVACSRCWGGIVQSMSRIWGELRYLTCGYLDECWWIMFDELDGFWLLVDVGKMSKKDITNLVIGIHSGLTILHVFWLLYIYIYLYRHTHTLTFEVFGFNRIVIQNVHSKRTQSSLGHPRTNLQHVMVWGRNKRKGSQWVSEFSDMELK